MGYPIKTINLNIKSTPFRGDGSGSSLSVLSMVEHDFRQYEKNGQKLPAHIDSNRLTENLVLYLDRDFQKELQIDNKDFFNNSYKYKDFLNVIVDAELTYPFLFNLYEKEKKRRTYMENKYNWLKSNAHYFTGFIINFSKLAQKEIVNELGIEVISQKVKDFCIDFFERIMGVKIVYIVCHLDESAPHFHGLVTNQRYYNFQYNHYQQLLNDQYFKYLSEKYFISDMTEKIAKGLWRTFSGTFTNSKEIVQKSSYRIPFSFLQDIMHYGFRDLNFERGKSKEERLAEGEPLWKVIARDVRTLHEDLPKEIEMKKEELRSLMDVIILMEEQKETLQTQIDEIKKQEDEIVNNIRKLKLDIQNLTSQKEEIIQQIKQLSQNKETYSSDELWLLRFIKNIIETESIEEIYKYIEQIKYNKLFSLMLLVDSYTNMIAKSNYTPEQLKVVKNAIINYLEEKGLIFTEIIQPEDEKFLVQQEKIKEMEKSINTFKKQVK